MLARIVETNSNNKFLVLFSDGAMEEFSIEGVLDLMSRNFRDCKPNKLSRSWKTVCADMAAYPGKTIAYQSDSGELVFADYQTLFEVISEVQAKPAEYISSAEYAKRYGVSLDQIKQFCRNGRIMGAIKLSGRWIIPVNAPYPSSRPRKAKILD